MVVTGNFPLYYLMVCVQAIFLLTSMAFGFVHFFPRLLKLIVDDGIGQVPIAFPNSTTPSTTVNVDCPLTSTSILNSMD